MEASKRFQSTVFPRISCLGPFLSGSPAPGVDGGYILSQKMAEVTRYTIASLDIHLGGMVAWADLKRSLTVLMKR